MMASSQPKISVCIANYNGAEIIRDCLNSVIQQECSEIFEIIVHDDASTDSSIEIITEEFPGIHLIESPKNVGYCVSNNRMVSAASGEFILLLNNDAILHDNGLQTLVTHAVNDQNIGVLTLPQYCATTHKLLDKGMFIDVFANPIPNTQSGTREVITVMGSCLWIGRELWEEIGGFPEWFESIAEDMYVCCYARLLGRTVKVIDQSGYDHHVGFSFGGGKAKNNKLITSLKRRRLSERNKSYLIVILFPGAYPYVILPIHLLLLFIEGFVLAIIKASPRILIDIYLYSIKSVILNMPKLLKIRKEVQKKRSKKNGKYWKLINFTPHKLTLLFKYGLPKIVG